MEYRHRRDVWPFSAGVSPTAVREGLRSTMQAIAKEHREITADQWLEPLMASRQLPARERAARDLRCRIADRRAHQSGADRGRRQSRQPGDVESDGPRPRARRAHGAGRSQKPDRPPAGRRIRAACRPRHARQPPVRVGGVDADREPGPVAAVSRLRPRLANAVRGVALGSARVAGGRRAAGVESRAAAFD